ncbi:MAG: hydrogenase iron-sulfur subunit [Sedimentisphaerales bacterium]|nr:hydrogenase iron-sulfur subunit [Sedimentisphaerales bacterium]
MIRRTATIHLFYCADSVTEADLQELQTHLDTDGLKTLSLPCSGKATIPYLLKAFEKGADGVVLCVCPESQCKHLEGNLRASRRAEAVEELLGEIGFGEGCVVVVAKEQGQNEPLIDTVQRLQARLSEVYSVGTKPARAVLADVRAGNRTGNAA